MILFFQLTIYFVMTLMAFYESVIGIWIIKLEKSPYILLFS